MTATPEQSPEETRKAALRAAYATATARLREAHRDDFNTFYSEEAEKLGQEWHPRRTPEQQASQEFDRLLEEFPFLRDRLPGSGEEG
jgi:hypothetical protein